MKNYKKILLIIIFICGVFTIGNFCCQDVQEYRNLDVNPKTSVITVTSPQVGDVWYKGNTYQITWTSTYVDDAVTIDLYQGGIQAGYFERIITTYTDDDGTYSWTIPTDLISNPDYIICIGDYDGVSSTGYSGEFTITDEPDDGNGDDTCVDSYSWCIQGGQELIWEVTQVDATGLESLYGANWSDVDDDRYIVGGKKKKLVDRITAFTEYCNWRVYTDSWYKWTTNAFSSTPDDDNNVDTVYMDPSSETWLTRHDLFPMDVVDYFASSGAGSSETISNNKVTYEASEYDSRPGTNVDVKWVYTYDENSGVLSKFQELDASDNVVWEYQLTSTVPDCSTTDDGDGTDGGGASVPSYDATLIFGLIVVVTSGIACVIWRKSIHLK